MFAYSFSWRLQPEGLGSFAAHGSLAGNMADTFYLLVQSGGVLSDRQHHTFTATIILWDGWYRFSIGATALPDIAMETEQPGEGDYAGSRVWAAAGVSVDARFETLHGRRPGGQGISEPVIAMSLVHRVGLRTGPDRRLLFSHHTTIGRGTQPSQHARAMKRRHQRDVAERISFTTNPEGV